MWIAHEDSQKFIRTNILGTHVLLEAARKYGVKNKFVQISTDEVYARWAMKGDIYEDSPLDPSSPYAASKAAVI